MVVVLDIGATVRGRILATGCTGADCTTRVGAGVDCTRAVPEGVDMGRMLAVRGAVSGVPDLKT